MKTKIRLVMALVGLLVLLGQPAWTADTDFQFVLPGVTFTEVSTGATGATAYEWNKQPTGGAWTAFTGTAVSVTDSLTLKAAARYRLRGYTVGWTCDTSGCRELGARVYGEWSDPSDWLIAATIPSCGKAVTPAKAP